MQWRKSATSHVKSVGREKQIKRTEYNSSEMGYFDINSEFKNIVQE